jgi:hypothetical protein
MPVKGLKLLPFIALAMFASVGAFAEEPRGMLGASDLKSIVLSPKPLGPPAHFEQAAKPMAAPAVATTQPAAPRKNTRTQPRQKAAVAARKPKAPLDSYARDARRQSWPCTGGGICAWTQPR